MQLARHAGHGIDLASHRRDVERIHHRSRGDAERHRAINRQRQFIDGGDFLLRIDKQPFPVERDNIDFQRLNARRDRLALGHFVKWTERIEHMGIDPGHAAQRQHDGQRRRPNHQFQLGRVMPFRFITGFGAVAVFPREQHRQSHHRHDDQQHQHGRNDHEMRFLLGDVARRVENDRMTGGERGSQGNHAKLARTAKGGKVADAHTIARKRLMLQVR